MGIYYGYSLFRKHKGRILLLNLPNNKRKVIYGVLSRLDAKYIIEINKNISNEEKLKTYIHELLHLGLEYKELQKHGFSKGPRSGLEVEIEKLTEVIFQMQSGLVRQLRFDLERALLSKNHSCYI